MECNRDEALRAKGIAEEKFLANDLVGAKKFALKAQNLYPSLDGINQLIATLEIHFSSVARFDAGKDWYSILCVNPSADDETVKKQYRKLALQFHPDKNKSVGAEGAFKLISEAWTILSDKTKRMAYDQKRFGRSFQPKATTVNKSHPVPSTSSVFHSFVNKGAPKVRPQRRNTGTTPTPSFSKPHPPGTFWTSCKHCMMQYEYHRTYLGYNLLCPKCGKSFLAIEIENPTNGPNHSSQSSSQPFQQTSDLNSSTKNSNVASNHVGSSAYQHRVVPEFDSTSKFQWGPFSRTTGTASASASTTAAAQAANVVHQTYEKVRREREQAQSAAKREEALRRRSGLKRSCSGIEHTSLKAEDPAKRSRGINDDASTYYGRQTGNAAMYPTKLSECGVYSRRLSIRRGFPQGHVLKTLMDKSKDEIHKIVQTWVSVKAGKSEEKEHTKKKKKLKESVVSEKVAEEKHEKTEENHEKATPQDRVAEPCNDSKQNPTERDSAKIQDSESDKEVVEPVSMDVPDPDFHDFDQDRTERAFKGDEIWATYDNEDGMPRYYVYVQKVISWKPFKVRMSFLHSKSNSEFGPLNWVASGFAKTSGEFRVSKYEVNDTLNVFSHKVKWEKGPRGLIKIVPRKGDIWALYRNWSPDWNEHTPDEVMYKYDMVEILEDYNEEHGVSIAPLVKVAGFKTVFQRHPKPKKVSKIPREEMFRLSHQVPSHVLTGEEHHNAPKGFYELDPAATPLELLQVFTETKEDKVMQMSELQQGQTVS